MTGWLHLAWPGAISTGLAVEITVRVSALLSVAALASLVMRRLPARARSVLWSVTAATVLLLPPAFLLLPRWEVDIPASTLLTPAGEAAPAGMAIEGAQPSPSAAAWTVGSARPASDAWRPATAAPTGVPDALRSRTSAIGPAIVLTWIAGTVIGLGWVAIGLVRVRGLTARGRPADSPGWIRTTRACVHQVGLSRPLDIRFSPEVGTPVTWGSRRPVVLLPESAASWCTERRRAVLLHEVVHARRHDWATRLLARTVAAIHFFNPLAWLMLRQLVAAQEASCDDEVLALGERPSSYAAHLLAIARSVAAPPAAAVAAPTLTRRTQMEERIMAILDPRLGRRAGLSLTLPLGFAVAGLMPALATVQPAPAQRAAVQARVASSPDLADVIREMERVEEEMQPVLDQLRVAEDRMRPQLDRLADAEMALRPSTADVRAVESDLEPFLAQMKSLEREMEPFRQRMETAERDLEPFHEAMRRIEERMRPHLSRLEDLDSRNLADLHELAGEVETALAPLHEELEQIHADMAPALDELDRIHTEMGPIHERIEAVHLEMEPTLERLDAMRESMEPLHRHLEDLHLDVEPFHRRMDELHETMEPYHQRLDELHRRLQEVLSVEISSILREELAAVTVDDAPFDETARALLEEASRHIHVRDASVEVAFDPIRARSVLADRLGPFRDPGTTGDELDKALQSTIELLSGLEITPAG